MIARGVDMAAGLVTLRLLAPYLGPARFGDYGFTWAFVLAMQPVVNFEMDRILIREAARDRSRTASLWGAALLVKAVMLVPYTAVVIGAACVLPLPPGVAGALLLAGASELFYHLHMIHSSVFQARERMDADLALMVFFRVTLLAGIVAGVTGRRPLAFFFAAAALANVVRAILGASVLLSRVGSPSFERARETAREMVRSAWPLTLSAVLAALTLNVDVFVLKAMASPEQVGYFQLAHPIILQLQIVPGALMTALFPGFARAFAADPRVLASFVTRAVKVFFAIGMLLALVLHGAAGLLVALFGAGRYAAAEPVLGILALALPAVFGLTLFSFALVSADGQKDLAAASFLGLVTNTVLDIVLVPRLGARGAALGTSVAYFTMASLYGVRACRRLPGSVPASLLATVLAGFGGALGALAIARLALPPPAAALLVAVAFAPLALRLGWPVLRDLARPRA